jgi:hypothetical protein
MYFHVCFINILSCRLWPTSIQDLIFRIFSFMYVFNSCFHVLQALATILDHLTKQNDKKKAALVSCEETNLPVDPACLSDMHVLPTCSTPAWVCVSPARACSLTSLCDQPAWLHGPRVCPTGLCVSPVFVSVLAWCPFLLFPFYLFPSVSSLPVSPSCRHVLYDLAACATACLPLCLALSLFFCLHFSILHAADS